MLLLQNETLTIPLIFCISVLTHHMDMDRGMFKAKEHKYEPVCSK